MASCLVRDAQLVVASVALVIAIAATIKAGHELNKVLTDVVTP